MVDLRRRAAPLSTEERDGYVAGLQFARLLRDRWPDFFQARLAHRSLCRESLLGAMGAFLSLAHTQLIQIDAEAYALTDAPMSFFNKSRWPFKPTNPADALVPWHGPATSLALLANEGMAWLARPIPRAYGINVHGEINQGRGYAVGRTLDTGLLALAIWKLLAHTAWSPLPCERIDELALTRAHNDQLGRAIAGALRPLSAATPLAPMCAVLDQISRPGLPRLGTMIAYLCGRTGNPFADVPQAALRQDEGHRIFNLSWATSDFVALRRRQDQSQTWHRSLSGSKGRFLRDWQQLLPILRDAVYAAAAQANTMSWGLTNEESTYQPAALYWSTS